ncbi:ArdC family protein [Mucilaginibacter sp. SJ]|uniref:ArdC family protein n=1 Tax=Mucilaginibacter sp. SJ TaxID=3029053 RepID=UPI0023A981CE|nr:zincin-like metallopeptidase domain-containing protein [Mucilaginibacter sp. SJ]WEA01715.1 zincin-like metallopeptidase domain-containing protein [Mucilaginibacter sp. SJ]
MSKNFKPLHEQIANKLIAELKAGTSPFQKPWSETDAPAFTIPVNPTTNKNYRGMNSLWLSMQGYQDPRWMTLKQADFAGYTVEKGAKATLINFVKTSNIEAIRDVDGNKITDEDGKTMTRVTNLDKPMITNAWVFNAEQIKGIPPLPEYLKSAEVEQKWAPLERAEKLLEASKAVINHGGNEAYYSKSRDIIQLPGKAQFDNETKYYAVALHELGHWTGHSSRLDRPMEGRFGSEKYAREELRAEIASLMLGSELKIGHNFGQHAAYVNSWVKILKDEPFELFRASADAQKIFDFVLDIERKLDVKREAAPAQAFEKGEQIAYNNSTVSVLETYKNKNLKVEFADGTRKSVKPTDALYKGLLDAKNNPAEQLMEVAAVEQEINHKIGR